MINTRCRSVVPAAITMISSQISRLMSSAQRNLSDWLSCAQPYLKTPVEDGLDGYRCIHWWWQRTSEVICHGGRVWGNHLKILPVTPLCCALLRFTPSPACLKMILRPSCHVSLDNTHVAYSTCDNCAHYCPNTGNVVSDFQYWVSLSIR